MKKICKFMLFLIFICLNTNVIFSQWLKKNAPSTTHQITSLFCNGGYIFAGTSSGEIFISSNKSQTWIKAENGPSEFEIKKFVNVENKIFAGLRGGGVYLSTDNGSNWTSVNNGLTESEVFDLAVSGYNIYAATWGGGVFKSTDDGANWIKINEELTNEYVNCIVSEGERICTGTDNGGVFLSTNSGISWKDIKINLTSESVESISISGNYIYAGTWGKGVFMSTDSGDSWIHASGTFFLSDNIVEILREQNIIFAFSEYDGVYYSKDNCKNWNAINNGFFDLSVGSAALDNINIYAGSFPNLGSDVNSIYTAKLSDFGVTGVDVVNIKHNNSSIYPNPAMDFIVIYNFIGASSDATNIQVFNMLGIKVMDEISNSKNSLIKIDINNLPEGVYFVKIGTEMKMFLKQ